MMIIQDIFAGFIFGVAAGLSPGPLMALLVSETLKGHKKNGILVSISPIITDIPVLLISLSILNRIKEIEHLLTGVYFVGALFLFYLGYKNIKIKKLRIDTDLTGSLKKGIILNILNPYTYLFWFFIGAPYVSNAGLFGGFLFATFFFIGITGSMMMIAIFTQKLKKFIESRYYIYLLRFIGVLFFVFGFILLEDCLSKF